MLPITMLQSESFNKYTTTLENIIGNVIDEKSADEIETERDDQDLVIPKTFAYTLTLLDCAFNKRPFTGIWQLRYANDIFINLVNPYFVQICVTIKVIKLYNFLNSNQI